MAIAYTSPARQMACGNYETSNRAARLVAGNAAIKSMLREMVRNATAGSQVIGISVDSAEQLQAAIITTRLSRAKVQGPHSLHERKDASDVTFGTDYVAAVGLSAAPE